MNFLNIGFFFFFFGTRTVPSELGDGPTAPFRSPRSVQLNPKTSNTHAPDRVEGRRRRRLVRSPTDGGRARFYRSAGRARWRRAVRSANGRREISRRQKSDFAPPPPQIDGRVSSAAHARNVKLFFLPAKRSRGSFFFFFPHPRSGPNAGDGRRIGRTDLAGRPDTPNAVEQLIRFHRFRHSHVHGGGAGNGAARSRFSFREEYAQRIYSAMARLCGGPSGPLPDQC